MSFENDLDETIEQLILKKRYDSAHQVLEMVRTTYSRYEEFRQRLNKARDENY